MSSDDSAEEDVQALAARIDDARRREKEKIAAARKIVTLSASRASTELLSGVVVGGGLGYLLDKWFHTLPVFFILLLILGVAAATLNIYKLSSKQDAHPEFPPDNTGNAAESWDDDDADE